jgi:hypothetical protein
MFAAVALHGSVSEAAVELTTSSNFSTGFEVSEGYSAGYLVSDPNWLVDGDPLPLLGDFGYNASHGVELGAGTSMAIDFFSSQVAMVGWVDFYVKPAFSDSDDLPVSFDLGQAALAGFVRVGESGEVYALHGDGLGNGIWLSTGYVVATNAEGLASDWLRMTYRLDYSTQRWDLFLDDSLQMIDLGFIDANAPPLSGFNIKGSPLGSTYFDQFEAGFNNPLFTDEDNDGIADSYENAEGLDSSINDRDGDKDFDLVLNIYEYLDGLSAGNPDTDGDGVHDGAERAAGADPRAANAYDLEAVPYLETFETMAAGDLQGQGFWQVSGEGSAEVQSGQSYESTRSLRIEATNDARVEVHNSFDGSAETHVWVDFWMIPVRYASDAQIDLNDFELSGSSVFFLKENNQVCLLNGNGAGGGVSNDFSHVESASDWSRITIYKDYANQRFSLWINGVLVAENQGFAYVQPYFDGICFSHESEAALYIDRIEVSFDKVSGLDTDGDGLLDGIEDANNNGIVDSGETSPYLADSDGDGMVDSLELNRGLNPVLDDSAAFGTLITGTDGLSKSWAADFSTAGGYSAGALDGQLSWTAEGSATVTADESLDVASGAMTGTTFEHLFGVGDEQSLWISFRAKLVIGEMPDAESFADFGGLAFGYTDSNQISVWHPSLAGWEPLAVEATGDEWNQYAISLDYNTKTWSLVINGILITENLSLGSDPAYTFSQFKVLQASVEEGEDQLSNFDDIIISTAEPAGLDFDGDGLINSIERQVGSDLQLADTDGDGMGDLWEYESGLDLLDDDASLDTDEDGLINIDEFRFGFDPNVPDIEGAPGFASLEVWNGISGSSLVNLTNNARFPLEPSSRSLLTSLTSEYSSAGAANYGRRIRGTMTAPVTGDYVFWIASDDQSEFSAMV